MGGSFIAIDVEALLYGQGLVFLFVLVSFDMVKLKAKGAELLDLMMDFCKDWVIVLDGFLGVWCVRMTVDSSYDAAVVAVHMYDTRSWNDERVESRVLAKETKQHVETIGLC